jgi:hypothetical protein
MKTDAKLDRNWLKGKLSDAMHAGYCAGAICNRQMVLGKLRLLCVFVLVALVNRSAAADLTSRFQRHEKRIVQGRLISRANVSNGQGARSLPVITLKHEPASGSQFPAPQSRCARAKR